MLNPDRVGHRYPPYRYEVSREKVREYARATGAGPVPDSGEVLAPPTFAACFTINRLGEVIADPDLGAHWNLVHGSQEYVFHRPVAVGDTLVCVPHLADLTDRRRMELATIQIDCHDAGTDEPVLTSRATIIFLPPRADGAEGGAGR